jgi:hypothetical protein
MMKTTKPRALPVERPKDTTLLEMLRELQTLNVWDARPLTEAQSYSVRLFGNANVGNLLLTNLQVQGMLSHDRSCLIQRWYARTNLPEHGPVRDAFNAWANCATATFVLGGKPPQTVLSVRDLVARCPTYEEQETARPLRYDPVPMIVPVRQNISVQLDRFTPELNDRLLSAIAREGVVNPLLWIHLEGVQLPGIRYRDDTTERDSRWAPMFDQVIAHVMRLETEQKTAEERVIQYILGIAKEPGASADARAQAFAIADGIMEGRARG